MKKRLSLLLVMVMALTMVIGTGVCAWADDAFECTGKDGFHHFYSFGTTYTVTNDGPQKGETAVRGYYYYYNTSSYDDPRLEDENSSSHVLARLFIDDYTAGWYYADGIDGYKSCSGHTTHPDNPYASSPAATGSAHVHNFQYGVIYPATKDADGLECEMCACGAVRNTQPISAMAYALYDYALPMINAAKSGQTITFDFKEWNSFPKSFMEKLVAKSAQGVTFVFKYKVNHELQTITIPAGTPIDLNFEWYGYAKMAELYGMY